MCILPLRGLVLKDLIFGKEKVAAIIEYTAKKDTGKRHQTMWEVGSKCSYGTIADEVMQQQDLRYRYTKRTLQDLHTRTS
jgi:hypothetical protein